MFCPKCRSEYVDGITECADCGVPLVHELPAERLPEQGDIVVIRTFAFRQEAELARTILEAHGIPSTVVSDDAGGMRAELAFARGVQLLVNEADVEKAEAIFDDFEASLEEE